MVSVIKIVQGRVDASYAVHIFLDSSLLKRFAFIWRRCAHRKYSFTVHGRRVDTSTLAVCGSPPLP